MRTGGRWRRPVTCSRVRTGRWSSRPGRAGRPGTGGTARDGRDGPGQEATERDGHGPAPTHPGGGPEARRGTAELTLTLADRGVRPVVVRLPPTVHRDGDNGFVATTVGIARDKGGSGCIGDGSNRRPAVHRLDTAHLFRLAAEDAPAGSTLHAVAGDGAPIRDIAEVTGRHLCLPVASTAPGDATGHFTWLAQFPAPDIPASSTPTRELTGWQPTQPGLMEDLEKSHYFHPRNEVAQTGHTRVPAAAAAVGRAGHRQREQRSWIDGADDHGGIAGGGVPGSPTWRPRPR